MGFLRKKIMQFFLLPTANLNLLPDRRHTGQLMHVLLSKIDATTWLQKCSVT